MSLRNNKATMSKYKLVKQSKKLAKLKRNELRLSMRSSVSRTIQNIIKIFEEDEIKDVRLSASGNAIPKLLNVIEIVKHRVAGIHQTNVIKSISNEQIYEPLEEGLDEVVISKFLAVFEITLCKIEPEIKDETGYQEPISEDLIITTPWKRRRRMSAPRNRNSSRGRSSYRKDSNRKKKSPVKKKSFSSSRKKRNSNRKRKPKNASRSSSSSSDFHARKMKKVKQRNQQRNKRIQKRGKRRDKSTSSTKEKSVPKRRNQRRPQKQKKPRNQNYRADRRQKNRSITDSNDSFDHGQPKRKQNSRKSYAQKNKRPFKPQNTQKPRRQKNPRNDYKNKKWNSRNHKAAQNKNVLSESSDSSWEPPRNYRNQRQQQRGGRRRMY